MNTKRYSLVGHTKQDTKVTSTTASAHFATYVPETLSHALTSCQLGAQIRKETHQKIEEMWLKKTKDAQSWALNSHYLPDSPVPRGWEEWWYWLGLVPIEGWQRTPHITQALIKQTAQILAEAGYAIWINRNTATQHRDQRVGGISGDWTSPR